MIMMYVRSPSLHLASLDQRSPLGHPALYSSHSKLFNSMFCEICEIRLATHTCKLCGRRVCGLHITERGICEICSSAICSICNSRLSLRSCVLCGRLICNDCSIQIDEVRYVCIYCFMRFGKKKLKVSVST